MARIRSIHPNACDSEKLAKLSDAAERLFWRLQTHLDDEGRCEDDPRIIGARCAPLLSWSPVQVDGLLQEMADVRSPNGGDSGLLVRYHDSGGRAIMQGVKFDKFQNPRRPQKSSHEAPPIDRPALIPDIVRTSADNVGTRTDIVNPEGEVGEGEGAGAGDAREALLSDAVVCVMGRRNTVDRSEAKADPNAWLAAAAREIRQELIEAQRKATLPVFDSTELASLISDPPKPPPARPEDLEDERNRDCELCHGSLMATDDDGAYPCPTCNP